MSPNETSLTVHTSGSAKLVVESAPPPAEAVNVTVPLPVMVMAAWLVMLVDDPVVLVDDPVLLEDDPVIVMAESVVPVDSHPVRTTPAATISSTADSNQAFRVFIAFIPSIFTQTGVIFSS
jgi:hypothetical protein